jgi:hypothetical protein
MATFTYTAPPTSAANLAAWKADADVITLLAVGNALDAMIVTDGGVAYEYTAGALANAPTGGSAPTAAAIADAVWDEAQAGHTTSGTFGKYLDTEVSAVASGGITAEEIADAVVAEFAVTPVGANLVQIGGDAQSMADLKDFADAGYDPATNKVQGVVLVDTLTTYTGNTPQTGDAFARIGATGSGLTSLAPASTALSTAVWTGTKAGYLDAAISDASGATAAEVWAHGTRSLTDKVGYSLNLAQVGLTPRDLTSVADAALTVGDALVGAVSAAAGEAAIVATTFTKKTPAGTTIRTYVMDDAENPTSLT